MVTNVNYEEYLMMAADGELDAAGRAALAAFLAAHPELAAEAAIWENLRLQPDTAVVCVEKESLLRKQPKRIAIGWKIPVAVAAAAAVLAALIIIPQLLPQRHAFQIAHHFHQTPPETKSAHFPKPNMAPQLAKASKPTRKPLAKHEHVNDTVLVSRNTSDIITLPADKTQPLPIASMEIPAVAMVENMPATEQRLAPNEDGRQKAAFLRIRIADANQPAINLLKRGVEDRLAQATEAARKLRETSFAIRIGSKNHYLNF